MTSTSEPVRTVKDPTLPTGGDVDDYAGDDRSDYRAAASNARAGLRAWTERSRSRQEP